MKDLQRLSREERRRLTSNRYAPIALGLAILLLVLILGHTYWSRIERLFGSQDLDELQEIAYHIAMQTGESFHLSDSCYTDSLLTQLTDLQSDHIIRRIRQPWPDHLPFEFYVERLRELSRENGLTCDCIESVKEKRLLCTIKTGAFIGAQIVIDTQRRTKLSGREIAFVFRNLGALSNEKITEILDHGITFSYLASPDVYPSRRMKRTLEKAGIISIIELPADASGLAELGSPDSRASSGSAGDNLRTNYRELVRSLFGRHPNPRALFFRRSGDFDSVFVRTAIELAGETETTYLYENSSPDKIDSLAYAAGLTVISVKSVADYQNGSVNEIRPGLLRNLILSRIPVRRIIFFDAETLDVGELIDLQKSLRQLGVNTLDCISLADVLESL
jgi:hypothetical protein